MVDTSQHLEGLVLYQVDMPHYCCGILVNKNGYVTATAPIVEWARGRTFESFKAYIESKNGNLTEIGKVINNSNNCY